MAGKNVFVELLTIGRHFECAIQPELVIRVCPNRKEAILSISAQFHHMPERYERVHVGWHYAKVMQS